MNKQPAHPADSVVAIAIRIDRALRDFHKKHGVRPGFLTLGKREQRELVAYASIAPALWGAEEYLRMYRGDFRQCTFRHMEILPSSLDAHLSVSLHKISHEHQAPRSTRH